MTKQPQDTDRRDESAGRGDKVSLIRLMLATIPAWVVLLLLRLNTPLYIGDDAYMTFKVARNLLQGNGFVYNVGEYVLVTTTPLWTSLLAFVSWTLSCDPSEVFRPIGFVLDLLNCFLLVLLASCSGRYLLRASICSLAFAFSWHMTFASVVGMEPCLFVALMISSLLLQEDGRRRYLSGFLAALAFMTRPEGALLLLAIGICRLVKDRRMPWPEIISGSIVVFAYLSWLYFYFGSVLPHAGVAKSVAYYREPLQAFRALGDHIIMFTLTPLFDSTGILRGVLLFVLWAVWALGVYAACRQSLGQAIAGVFTALVIVLYVTMNPLLFEWYVVPLEVSYAISLVWGVCTLLRVFERITWDAFYTQCATAILMLFLFFAVFRYETPSIQLALKAGPGGYRGWPSLVDPALGKNSMQLPVLGPLRREELYIRLAKQIEGEVTSETVIIAPEYGAFGYHTDAKMLSSIGHTSKEMFKYLPAPREQVGNHINNSITQAMIDGFKPDYVLSLEAFIRKSLLVSERFSQEYELVEKLDSSVFSSDGLYLFRRKPPALPKVD